MHLHKKYSRHSTWIQYIHYIRANIEPHLHCRSVYTLDILYKRRQFGFSCLCFFFHSLWARFRGHPTIMILFYLLHFTIPLVTCPIPFSHFVLNGFFLSLQHFLIIAFRLKWKYDEKRKETKITKLENNGLVMCLLSWYVANTGSLLGGHKWLCHICESIARLPLFVMSYKATCEEKQGYWKKITRRCSIFFVRRRSVSNVFTFESIRYIILWKWCCSTGGMLSVSTYFRTQIHIAKC